MVILGPHAVGKMTVGQELVKLTGLTLFHNHMSVEFVRQVFGSLGNPEAKYLKVTFAKKFSSALQRAS